MSLRGYTRRWTSGKLLFRGCSTGVPLVAASGADAERLQAATNSQPAHGRGGFAARSAGGTDAWDH